MTTDVKRPFLRVQTGDNLETRLIGGTFRLFRVLQSNADLITPFRMFISFKILCWLNKVVLKEVEEDAVVLFPHPRVAYDESTICDNRSGRLIESERGGAVK